MLRPPKSSERGSAPVEASFAIVILMLLALGVMEVALALYGRNVLISSAHEGARAAVERGRDPREADAIARRTVESAAGGLIDDLEVSVVEQQVGFISVIRVNVSGVVNSFGPVPLPIPVSTNASATREMEVP
ncbi:MAG: TadE/TadG family type IV pilus assembly protein [Actinomycetota bacterium]